MGNLVATVGQSDNKTPEESNRVVTRYESQHQINTSAIEDPNLRLAIQSLDALISKALQDQQQQQQQQQLQKVKEDQVAENKDTSIASAFANLAHLLNRQLESNGVVARQAQQSTAMVTAPRYKCPMDTNRNHDQSTTNKVNYKNLFPRGSIGETAAPMETLLGNMFSTTSYQVEEIPNPLAPTSNQRRFSQMLGVQGASNLADSLGGTALDTIRINLPEILDQQDEITILRLLIKLLSTKVTKLSDEKRRLLANVAMLNDINAEMAAIIERSVQK